MSGSARRCSGSAITEENPFPLYSDRKRPLIREWIWEGSHAAGIVWIPAFAGMTAVLTLFRNAALPVPHLCHAHLAGAGQDRILDLAAHVRRHGDIMPDVAFLRLLEDLDLNAVGA